MLILITATYKFVENEIVDLVNAQFASKLLREFNAKDFSKDTVKNSDRLKIYENFFECMRIQTDAGVYFS